MGLLSILKNLFGKKETSNVNEEVSNTNNEVNTETVEENQTTSAEENVIKENTEKQEIEGEDNTVEEDKEDQAVDIEEKVATEQIEKIAVVQEGTESHAVITEEEEVDLELVEETTMVNEDTKSQEVNVEDEKSDTKQVEEIAETKEQAINQEVSADSVEETTVMNDEKEDQLVKAEDEEVATEQVEEATVIKEDTESQAVNIEENKEATNKIEEATITSESEAELFVKKFKDNNNIKKYDLDKILDDDFVKKLKLTREVDYEKYIKCSGTTARPDSFIAFDLETTGLNPQTNEIIEIGAIKFENDEPVEIFHTYVKPKRKISEKITKINGITNEMVVDAPKLEEVLPKFIDFIGDSVLIAYNSPFDMSFILENLYKGNYKKIKNKVIDVLKISRQKIREFDIEKERDKKLESYKLEELNWRFGLNLPSHNALDDCKACAYVYMKIKNECGGTCYVVY